MSKKKRKLKQLNNELASYTKVLQYSFLYTKTDPKGKIIDLNQSFCDSVGYSKKELLQNSHAMIKHPLMDPKEYTRLWQTILAKKVYKGLIKNKTKEGQTVYHNTTIIPLLNKKKKIKAFIALRYDATIEMEAMKELKQMMQSLLQKEQMMMHQSKLAQMGEMISMIAHQWRQPLSAISATTSDLDIKIALDGFEKEYFSTKLNNISEYTSHLSKTIDDFRNFFKQDKEKELTDFKTIVNSALNIIGMSLRNKKIALEVAYQSSNSIYVYPSEVQQVVLNLIKNAEDAILDKTPDAPLIYIKSFHSHGYECLEVSDNGGGISKEVEKNLFKAYFSTKKDKDGTGLGLHMSKIIIQDHCKGKISFGNKNGGAVFTIKIPQANKDAVKANFARN
ncbi:MAG: PAS domain-containing sensor histidine kinase [Campylobacterota bacterium]